MPDTMGEKPDDLPPYDSPAGRKLRQEPEPAQRRKPGRPKGARDKRPRKPGGGAKPGTGRGGSPPVNATIPPHIDISYLWSGTSPRLYDSAEDLAEAVLQFARWAQETGQPVTLTGLTLYVGFTSIHTLDKQADRGPDWCNVVQNARLFVQWAYESRLHGDKAPIGAIFALGNLDKAHWRDVRYREERKVLARVDLGRLPDEVIEAVASGEPLAAVLAAYLDKHGEAVAQLGAGLETDTTAEPFEAD